MFLEVPPQRSQQRRGEEEHKTSHADRQTGRVSRFLKVPESSLRFLNVFASFTPNRASRGEARSSTRQAN
jgi:hypothetical protein